MSLNIKWHKKLGWVVVLNIYLVSSQLSLIVAYVILSVAYFGDFIDMRVYKNLQYFRLEISTKQIFNKFKYLLPSKQV